LFEPFWAFLAQNLGMEKETLIFVSLAFSENQQNYKAL